MAGPQGETVPVVLRDGTAARVRPLGSDGDKAMLRDAYQRLSPESRYQRFLAPVSALSPHMLHRLVDHVDGTVHVALVLDVPHDDGWEPVGVGRYVRDQGRPVHAEVAVTVLDTWQGRGVGALLTRALADHATAGGVTHFTATVLAANTASLRMLGHAGPVVRTTPSYSGVVDLLIELAADGAAAASP